MIAAKLYAQMPADRIVRVGVVGTGHFATAVVTQSRATPRLDVVAAADINIEAAQRAYRLAGWPDEAVSVCDSVAEAEKAMARGQRVILRDAMLLMQLDLDVVVESTGLGDVGATDALAAIEHGKHVAMVNKEADSCVGPMLKRLADQAGVVYSAVDGDQHGLLMGHIAWLRSIGLGIHCGGKSKDTGLVYDPQAGTVGNRHEMIRLTGAQARYFEPIPRGGAVDYVAARKAILGHLGALGGYDLVELTIAANATGLAPDISELHCPPIRIVEIPTVMAPRANGGILEAGERVDCVTCLQGEHEAGLGGGVWATVAADTEYSRYILNTKGCLHNADGMAALVHHPHHLCGVETGSTLLAAGLLGLPTGASEYLPRYDVHARANRLLKAGEVVGDDHSPDLTALMRPAQRVGPGAPLPLHMACRLTLTCDVPAGEVITYDMVDRPVGSVLWRLRAQQDATFL